MSGLDHTRLPIVAARAAATKTDRPTVVLDVGEVLSICGWFVITSGGTDRQVRAIADAVEEAITEAGGPKPLRIEGLDEASWVLIDYGDVIVHVMDDESRSFYDLERLWRDVPVLNWTSVADPEWS
jgi:ribosome-associated protein